MLVVVAVVARPVVLEQLVGEVMGAVLTLVAAMERLILVEVAVAAVQEQHHRRRAV
jgi:hypothetical protein